MTSKTTFTPVFLMLLLNLLSPFVFYMSYNSPSAGFLFPTIYTLTILPFFWLTEFRTRAHRITIFSDGISVRSYFGLGPKRTYTFKELKGYIISQQPSRLKNYEFIFILKQDSRVIAISSYYHRNYEELKNNLEVKLPFLGEKEYKLKAEFTEMFR